MVSYGFIAVPGKYAEDYNSRSADMRGRKYASQVMHYIVHAFKIRRNINESGGLFFRNKKLVAYALLFNRQWEYVTYGF